MPSLAIPHNHPYKPTFLNLHSLSEPISHYFDCHLVESLWRDIVSKEEEENKNNI